MNTKPFIVLNPVNDKPFYVNPGKIIYMNAKAGGGSVVKIENYTSLPVLQSPEEILKLIREMESA